LTRVVEYPIARVPLLMSSLPCMQEVPPTEPVEEGDEGVWDTVGGPPEVIVRPPLSRSSWRSWSASPLLHRGARGL
jgi:hypothetical protein